MPCWAAVLRLLALPPLLGLWSYLPAVLWHAVESRRHSGIICLLFCGVLCETGDILRLGVFLHSCMFCYDLLCYPSGC